jgi:hypothetical protein
MSAACSEIVLLRGLLAELGFSQSNPTPLHADNTSAIQIAANPVYHERMKHIESFYSGSLGHSCYITSSCFYDLQIADVFTKAMTR